MKADTWKRFAYPLIAVAALGGFFAGSNIDLPAMAAEPAGAIMTFADPDFENALRKHIVKKFLFNIGATEDQKKKISAIIEGQAEARSAERKELRKGAIELAQLMGSDTATDDEIVQKVHELRAMHEKLMDERVETALKVRSNLTSEQRKTISERVVSLLSGNCKFRKHLL